MKSPLPGLPAPAPERIECNNFAIMSFYSATWVSVTWRLNNASSRSFITA